MLAAKTFIGERLDLEHYKGIAIQNFELEVLDANDDPFDFSGHDGFTLEIFAKPHGKSLESYSLEQPTDNKIYLLADSALFLSLRSSLYFYEVYAFTTASPSFKTLISYGNLAL